MQPRRQVRRGETFLEHALALYPRGGDAKGSPSFELFEAGPLGAVEQLCARRFDLLQEVAPGIRVALTHDVPLFPAMAFYAIELTDGSVEILDVTIDEGYFELIGDDPTD